MAQALGQAAEEACIASLRMRRTPYTAVLTVVTAAMTAGYRLGRNRRHEPADHLPAWGLLAAST